MSHPRSAFVLHNRIRFFAIGRAKEFHIIFYHNECVGSFNFLFDLELKGFVFHIRSISVVFHLQNIAMGPCSFAHIGCWNRSIDKTLHKLVHTSFTKKCIKIVVFFKDPGPIGNYHLYLNIMHNLITNLCKF